MTVFVRLIRGAVAGVGLAALAAGAASAQEAAPRAASVGVAGGVGFPIGEVADDLDLNTGFTVLGFLGWQPPYQAFGVRGEISYSKFNADAFIGDRDITKFGGALNGILTISNDGSFRPYVIAGAGVYNVKNNFDAGIIGVTTDDQTKLGLNGGVGAMFRLGGLTGTLEARYVTVFLDGDDNLNVIPITIGLTL